MNIHQIQVKFDPLADRLILLVRTQDAQLFKVWLTRRMLVRLWPALGGSLGHLAAVKAAPQALVAPDARNMLAAHAKASALNQADFSTPFEDQDLQTPMGGEPMLPEAVDVSALQNGDMRLRFRAPGGTSLELMVQEAMIHATMSLIEKAVAQAEWGLTLGDEADEPSQALTARPAPAGTLLN